MAYKKVLFNSVLYMLATFMPQAILFFLLPIFSHYIDPADYGVYALLSLFSSVLPLLFTFNLWVSVDRFFFIYAGDKLRSYISSIYILNAFIAVFVAAVMYLNINIIVSKLFPSVDTAYVYLFKLIIVTSIFISISRVSTSLIRVREKAKVLLANSLISILSKTAVSILLIIFFKIGIAGLVYANLLMNAVSTLHLLYSNRSMFGTPNFKLLIEPAKYALPTIPHTLSGLVYLYSDRFILEKYVTSASLGLYFFSDQLTSVIKSVVNQFNFAYQPSFINTATRDVTSALKETRYIFEKFLIGLAVLTSMGVLFSPELLSLFVEEKYHSAWIYFSVIAFGYLFRALYLALSNLIIFEKKTALISVVSVVSGVTNVVINLIFIPKYGTIVAAVSMVISLFMTFFLAQIFVYKRNGFFLLTKNMVGILIYAFVAILITFTFSYLLPFKVLYAGIGLFVLYRIKVFKLLGIINFAKEK